MKKLINIDKAPADTKVVVAMSGGVDSSTVAVMLHNAGYDVIGVTLQLYDYGAVVAKKGACCAGQDIYDAKMVAEKFGFPHYVLDYESIFKDEVMDDFADSYLRGETPIPCVKCNQSVKFRDLFKVAKDLNADALVTGHYVQRIDVDGKAQMHRAHDKNKDQSYFLFATTQEQLDYLHFPLGGMSKEETRKIAEEVGIEIYDKPDSQDICFVPNGDYASIVQKLRPGAIDDGEIVHMDGRVLGKHNGIINFTIGQRRGIGIGGQEDPLYVVKIEPDTKRVIVGPESALESTKFKIRNVNWLVDNKCHPVFITGSSPDCQDNSVEAGYRHKDGMTTESFEAQVKIRSIMQPIPAKITPLTSPLSGGIEGGGNSAEITLLAPHKAITPGQACVIYDGERVIGGGWIRRE
ncbi:MAG: tRNA 2-thiouridine(34) synthase MnmA [Alphaproteobacteria bacterium CG11_big_fil_rev_8_21_14_0_20_44_7]|nr:MAG: tRNA 2-thiouridine(34) synthase MnmA [Alphaproteobacteria bacterium CG11_big_fil_rev_8_21_14_0_20_44_7]